MRIVAAVGIVWFHLGAPGPAVGTIALPLFLMLSGMLSVGSLQRRGTREFWQSRVQRLLVPWAIWSLIYLAVEAERFGWRAALVLEDPLSLLVGPEIHLWFLPFVALASGLSVAADRLLTTPARLGIGAVALAMLCALPVWLHETRGLPVPFAQWSVALAPFAYGVLAGLGRVRGAPLAAPGFAGLVAVVAVAGWGSPLAPYLPLAALAFEGLWRLPIRLPGLPRLGNLTYGIYFAHPLVALIWYALGGGRGVEGAFAVIAGSAAFAWALGQALAAGRRLLRSGGRAATPPARARA